MADTEPWKMQWDGGEPAGSSSAAKPAEAAPWEMPWDVHGSADSEKPGGFVASAKQSIGSAIKGAGQAAADFIPGVGQDNAVKRYGQEVIDANPTAVKSLGDIADKPGAAVKEAVGNAAGSMGGMLGARLLGQGITAAAPLTGPFAPVTAAVGQGVAWLGPAAVAALPSFGGIREQQIKDDPSKADDLGAKARAATGAAAVGAIESKFGPQEWALGALTKEGRAKLAEKFAAKTAAGSIGKGIAQGAAVEGAEELVQNPIEQVAAYQDPTTAENVQDTLFGGAMGAIGGGVMGGGFAGVSRAMGGKEQGAQPVEGAPEAEAAPLGLPAPTYTGTPSEQVLQAEAERQNQVAEAQARADALYRRRDEVDAARQPQEAGPDFSPVRDAYTAQLEALRQQEAGQPDVPQSTPPDGRAILEAQRAAGRAVTGPDDEILQSIGAAEPPHRAMGIDPAAGPLSAGAAIAVDTGVHGQMQAAAQQAGQVEQAGAQPVAGPLQSSVPQAAEATPAQRWASMSADERTSIAGQIGLPPVIARNIPRAGWESLNPDLQGRLSSAMAPASGSSSTSPNPSAGNGWAAFGPESGTVGVPRAQMPQIKAEHRGAMVNFMNARGVSHREETIPAGALKPTQAEFSPEKVARAKARDGGDRAILVSSDNHVLDGHHQWLAALDKGEDVRAIRLNAPIRDLVGLAHEFPSSTTSTASEAPQRLGDRGRAAEEADTLRAMAQDAGWAERGGLLIRDTAGNATGRTKWLPRAEWFMAGMEADPETLARDIDRFVAGEKVPARSRRTIEGMLEWLDAQRTGQPLNEDSAAAEWERVGYNEASAEEQAAFDAIEAFIDSAPQLSERDALLALGFTEDEIRAEIEGTGSKGRAGEADAGAAQERAADDRQGPQDEAAGTFLEGYSEAELAARDEAQRLADESRAKAEKAADDKARADAERDTFALTGSDRPADVMAAQGQGGLFDASASKPAARNQEPVKNETPAASRVSRNSAPANQESIKKAEPVTPAERWDAMTAEQRGEVLMQPGGWATAAGGINAIGKRLASQVLDQMAPMTRATVERLMGKALAQDFSLSPVEVMEGGKPETAATESYNDRVRRQQREIRIQQLQSNATITQANGKPFKTDKSAGAFSDANELGDTHEVAAVPGGFVLRKLPPARRPSAIAAAEARRAADPEAQRQDAAFARAEKVGTAAQQAIADYEDGKTDIDEFEAALDAVAAPAVGKAPSPLEALFSDLNSDSTRKANKARKAAAKLPQAERITYVQANFHDILIRLMEAGALEVNGTSTLNEDNKQCL